MFGHLDPLRQHFFWIWGQLSSAIQAATGLDRSMTPDNSFGIFRPSLETTAIFEDILTVARKYVSDRGHALYIEKRSP